MSDFSDLKQEILEWATSNVAMKEFTTHDVYDRVHSALSSEQTSDALRRLYKEGKLNRKEFMDGNRKKFIYSLVNVKKETINEEKEDDQISLSEEYVNLEQEHLRLIEQENKKAAMIKKQQIEIPNNFCIELKAPNGFTITIKAGDLMK